MSEFICHGQRLARSRNRWKWTAAFLLLALGWMMFRDAWFKAAEWGWM